MITIGHKERECRSNKCPTHKAGNSDDGGDGVKTVNVSGHQESEYLSHSKW